MRPLIRRAARAQTADPAPSRWSYRAQRLWLTPVFRIGLPIGLCAGLTALYFADEGNRQALLDGAHEIRREIENRPEFRVNLVGIDGASPFVTEEVRTALALDLPRSSFDIDLDELRDQVEALPAVASADVRLQSGGYLAVTIDERTPAVVWQTRAGPILIDREGHYIAPLSARRPDTPLPVVAGQRADQLVEEALALHAAAAGPLGERLLGLTLMGERRWDVVLTDGRRILLPEANPGMALDRALALQEVTDILSRDIVRLDLRHPGRMSVQVSRSALEEMRMHGALDPQPINGGGRG